MAVGGKPVANYKDVARLVPASPADRDVVGLVGASLVFGAVFGAGLRRAYGRSSWPKEVDARRHDNHRRGHRDQCGGQRLSIALYRTASRWGGSRHRFSSELVATFRKYCRNARARMMVAAIACQSVGMLLAAVIALLLLKNVHGARPGGFS